MLNLTATTDKLQLTTSSTADIEVHVSGTDVDNTTPTAQVFVPFRTHTAITSIATTDIQAAPAASHYLNVKFINIRNTHATTSNDVTVTFDQNATDYRLFKCTLAAGEELVMREGVWFHYDVYGGVYGQQLPAASDTVAGGIQLATQSDMESASSVLLAVTPGRLKYHPGVAKAVMFTTGTATPVASTPPTYNCTLTDSGVGRLTVNFTTAFSATTAYAVQVNVEIISTTLTAAANVMNGYMRFGGQASASACELNCCDRTATTNVIRDPISWHVVAFGDQA